MVTPNLMPKKVNPIHTQILGSLIDAKPHKWEQRTFVRVDGVETLVMAPHVHGETLRWPLAQNVSDENVDRLAARWGA